MPQSHATTLLPGLALAAAVAMAAIVAPASSQTRAPDPSAANLATMLASWPRSARAAADDMMTKYGPPQEVTPTMLIWRDNGPWKHTIVSRAETPHNFPMPHANVMEQAINYRVAPDRFDELAHYNGSVVVERTRGELSARSDREAANFLALNLAHDIVSGRRTAEEARAYHARAIATALSGARADPYMERLTFETGLGSADPDRPATRLR